MKSRSGGKLSKATDPDQMIAEAIKADRRSQLISDLILGPMLLVGGIGVTVLSFTVATRAGGGIYVVAGGAILAGLAKTGRGLGRLLGG